MLCLTQSSIPLILVSWISPRSFGLLLPKRPPANLWSAIKPPGRSPGSFVIRLVPASVGQISLTIQTTRIISLRFFLSTSKGSSILMTNMLRFLFTTILATKVVYNDAPQPWQIGFQDGGSPSFEGIIELHDQVMFYLIVILLGVGWMLSSTIRKFNSHHNQIVHKYHNHGLKGPSGQQKPVCSPHWTQVVTTRLLVLIVLLSLLYP